MESFLGKDYYLFTDNWYNSFATNKTHVLTKNLHHRHLEIPYSVYIKYIPVNVMKKKLKKGEMIWKSLTDISVIK